MAPNDTPICNGNDNVERQIQDTAVAAFAISQKPILQLVKLITGNDFSHQYGIDLESDKKSYLTLTNRETSEKAYVYLDIVSKDWDFLDDIKKLSCFGKANSMESLPEGSKEQVIGVVSHMFNSCNFVFNRMRADHLELVEYPMNMTPNTTIILENETNYAIGARFTSDSPY